MTTKTDPKVAAHHSTHESRSRATRAKGKAADDGWTNLSTAKQHDGEFWVVGTPPAPKAPPATKAKKKTPAPTPAADEPTPKPKATADLASVQRFKKDGTPAKSKGVKGGRPVGVTSGLGVEATWVAIFTREAAAPKSKRLTDEQITAEMAANFPGRGSDVFRRVGTVRAKFNRGAFACQGGVTPAKKAEKQGAKR